MFMPSEDDTSAKVCAIMDFDVAPVISDPNPRSSKQAATIGDVDSRISSTVFAGPPASDYSPLVDDGRGGGYASEDLPTFWFLNPTEHEGTMFPDGITDSDWIAYRQTNTLIAEETGYATVWGWLADNGNVSPEHAWVGLYA